MAARTGRKVSEPSAIYDESTAVEPGDVVGLKGPHEVRGDEVLGGAQERTYEFTHGVVAEIVSKRSVCPSSSLVAGESVGKMVPRSVALFLFNPESGRILLGSGPAGSAGIPTFVDFLVDELVLIQKHDESYSVREHDLSEGW